MDESAFRDPLRERSSDHQFLPLERVVSLIAIAALFLAVFGALITACFYIVEDRTLFRLAASALEDWRTRVAADAAGYGRFRPVYWMYVVLSFAAYGTNASLWHAAALLWGIITCYLLYLSIRMLGVNIVAATLFALSLVLSGRQNWIWIDLVPAETSGMLLTAVATFLVVAASSRVPSWRWHVPVLVALALMGVAKESFAILIPSLLVLRVVGHKVFSGQSWRQSLQVLSGLLVCGVLVFAGEMAAIIGVMIATPGGYSSQAAGLSQSSVTVNALRTFISAQPASAGWGLLATVVAFGVLWFERRDRRGLILAGSVVAGLWVVPQVLLYRTNMEERYLFPCVVGLFAVAAIALSELRRFSRLWVASYLGVIIVTAGLAARVPGTIGTVDWFVAETRASNRMVQFLAQNVPPSETILMAGDSGTPYGFEATYALPAYLRVAGLTSPFFLWPLTATGGRTALHITASRNNTAFSFPETLRPSDVGAIALVEQMVPPLDLAPLRVWLGESQWREVRFSEPTSTFSWRQLGFVRVGEVTDRILLSTQSRQAPSARPLITVDSALASVEVGQVLETPPWGLEADYAGSGRSVLWLGYGQAEDLAWRLTSLNEEPVEIDVEVVPGPSRADYRRTVDLVLDGASGHQVLHRNFDAGRWTFDVRLSPGANRLQMTVIDEPTIAVQPGGDTRHLLALVRRLTIRKPPR